MATNLLTIGYLKSFTKGIITIKKEYSNIDNETIVSYDDILSGKYFQYFKNNDNPKSIISGLYLDEISLNKNEATEDEIKLIYPKLMDIILSSDTNNISPCGGSIELTTMAYFNIMERNYNGEISISKTSVETNPVLRHDNELFKLDNHLCSIDANLSDTPRKDLIIASYMFRNVIKKSSLEIIQSNNELTDWIFEKTITDGIEISCSNTLFDKEGGLCEISVLRNYSKTFYKNDSCGNRIKEKKEEGYKDDISRLCILSSTNNEHFIRNGNIITVLKQDVDSDKKYCIISAEYDNFNDSITIYQNEGDKSSYSYSLSFIDGGNFLVKSLSNSLPTSFNVPLISNKNLIINDKLISSIPYYDLKFVKYDDWYEVSINEETETISLDINIKECNTNKYLDRETELEIYNPANIENKIKVHIIQPRNKQIDSFFELQMTSGDTFTYDTINTSKIEFKPLKTLCYEDGSEEKKYCLDKNLKIAVNSSSSDYSILECGKLIPIDFNGTHIMKPIYHGLEIHNDVVLDIESHIEDVNGNEITNPVCTSIVLKGVDIITYEYEFSFDNGEIFKELVWEYGDISERHLVLNDKKIKLINGLPYEYDNTNSFNYEKCENFYVDIKGNDILIKPREINSTNTDRLINKVLYQKESGKKVSLCLTQNGKPKSEYIKLSLTLDVKKNNIDEDVWADYDSYLVVTRESNEEIVKEIPLNKWWLYPTIEGNHDVIYKGENEFIIGENYNFKVIKLVNIDNFNYEMNYCLLNESYLIEKDDEGIDLTINI